MHTNRRPYTLTEKELGTLYAYTEVPLILHHALEKGPMNDKIASTLHDMLSNQAPDDALISFSLCGFVLAEKIAEDFKDLRPLAAELRTNSDRILGSLGRLRLDLDLYNTPVDQASILETLSDVPDDLCIMVSLYQDIFEALKPSENNVVKFLRILFYQAEAQTDRARLYLDSLNDQMSDMASEECCEDTGKGTHQKDGQKTAYKRSKTAALDDIPLPPDLQPQRDPAKIVDFSLFRR